MVCLLFICVCISVSYHDLESLFYASFRLTLTLSKQFLCISHQRKWNTWLIILLFASISVTSRNSNTPKKFYLHPCLASEASETQFLREMVEVMLVLVLPQHISGFETARHLLREIVTCTGIASVYWICSELLKSLIRSVDNNWNFFKIRNKVELTRAWQFYPSRSTNCFRVAHLLHLTLRFPVSSNVRRGGVSRLLSYQTKHVV